MFAGIFGSFQHWEVLVILGIALLLFGPKLPSIARSIGKSIVEFKKGVKGVQDDLETASKPDAEQKRVEDKASREIEVKKVEGKEKVSG